MPDTSNILYAEECYKIQGAIFDVYKEMGCGFLESIYHQCLSKEFEMRRIPFESEKALKVQYKGIDLDGCVKPDFICYGKIIVEIKASTRNSPEYKAQVINCLKATGAKLGLLVNFGTHPKVFIERCVL